MKNCKVKRNCLFPSLIVAMMLLSEQKVLHAHSWFCNINYQSQVFTGFNFFTRNKHLLTASKSDCLLSSKWATRPDEIDSAGNVTYDIGGQPRKVLWNAQAQQWQYTAPSGEGIPLNSPKFTHVPLDYIGARIEQDMAGGAKNKTKKAQTLKSAMESKTATTDQGEAASLIEKQRREREAAMQGERRVSEEKKVEEVGSGLDPNQQYMKEAAEKSVKNIQTEIDELAPPTQKLNLKDYMLKKMQGIPQEKPPADTTAPAKPSARTLQESMQRVGLGNPNMPSFDNMASTISMPLRADEIDSNGNIKVRIGFGTPEKNILYYPELDAYGYEEGGNFIQYDTPSFQKLLDTKNADARKVKPVAVASIPMPSGDVRDAFAYAPTKYTYKDSAGVEASADVVPYSEVLTGIPLVKEKTAEFPEIIPDINNLDLKTQRVLLRNYYKTIGLTPYGEGNYQDEVRKFALDIESETGTQERGYMEAYAKRLPKYKAIAEDLLSQRNIINGAILDRVIGEKENPLAPPPEVAADPKKLQEWLDNQSIDQATKDMIMKSPGKYFSTGGSVGTSNSSQSSIADSIRNIIYDPSTLAYQVGHESVSRALPVQGKFGLTKEGAEDLTKIMQLYPQYFLHWAKEKPITSVEGITPSDMLFKYQKAAITGDKKYYDELFSAVDRVIPGKGDELRKQSKYTPWSYYEMNNPLAADINTSSSVQKSTSFNFNKDQKVSTPKEPKTPENVANFRWTQTPIDGASTFGSFDQWANKAKVSKTLGMSETDIAKGMQDMGGQFYKDVDSSDEMKDMVKFSGNTTYNTLRAMYNADGSAGKMAGLVGSALKSIVASVVAKNQSDMAKSDAELKAMFGKDFESTDTLSWATKHINPNKNGKYPANMNTILGATEQTQAIRDLVNNLRSGSFSRQFASQFGLPGVLTVANQLKEDIGNNLLKDKAARTLMIDGLSPEYKKNAKLLNNPSQFVESEMKEYWTVMGLLRAADLINVTK